MFNTLLIPQFPQQYALDLVRAYSSGFADRVLPGFQDIEAEADAASEAYFDSRMNQVASEDEPWLDEGAVARMGRNTDSACTPTLSSFASRLRDWLSPASTTSGRGW